MATVYLPYFSDDAKARTARVQQGRLHKEEQAQQMPSEIDDSNITPTSGTPAGSMWKNMKNK